MRIDMRLPLSAILGVYCFSSVFGQQVFTDVTKEAGIEHQFEVYEGTFGGGAVVFDMDNDGFEDVFITGGMNEDVLYRNNGDGTFFNVYKGSGLESSKHFVTQGAASADVNRDGYRDLFITTINTTDGSNTIPRAHNLLYLNNKGKGFIDVTEAYGLKKFNSFSTGASFGDINEDGFPDLFVGNYFREFEGTLGTIKDATIVSASQTSKDYLLINDKGKGFVNESEAYGLNHSGFGFGGVFTDFDQDGHLDIFVNNDFGYKSTPNLVYQNKAPWKGFKEIGEHFGLDLPINAMGTAIGDYDNNGVFEYFVSNIKFNRFMVQGADNNFTDQAKQLGTYAFAISWGVNFADFDHDGDLDLFVSNGDLNPNCTPMANFFYENNAGSYTDMASLKKVNDPGVGRGSVVFDMDNDGDLDLLVVNQKPIYSYPTPSFTKLYRNDQNEGNWLKIALQGMQTDLQGLGSTVEVQAGGKRYLRQIDGANSSHMSQNSIIAHFGLGEAELVEKIIVHWVGGDKQILTAQQVNQLLVVTQDSAGGWSWYMYLALGFGVVIVFWVFRAKRRKGN